MYIFETYWNSLTTLWLLLSLSNEHIVLCTKYNNIQYFLEQRDVQDTLKRQNAEILKKIFPEKEYRGLSPNFHIHASVSDFNY